MRDGVSPDEVFYDLLLAHDGHELLVRPLLNYTDFTLDPLREMLEHPTSVLGLGDGGAHCGTICDASTPTFMLTHWVRDRTRGPRLPLELVIHKMTADTAALYGLGDRGTVALGKKGDVNVIDLERLQLHSAGDGERPARGRPPVRAGRRRLRATIVSGEAIRRDGDDTGARPRQARTLRLMTETQRRRGRMPGTPERSRPDVKDTLRDSAEDIAWNEPGAAVRVPVYRYLSPEFAAREEQRLWPKVWQIACTVDHVAEPGDYFEYRVGPYSVLIVRGDDGELRAFQNVVPSPRELDLPGERRGPHPDPVPVASLDVGSHGRAARGAVTQVVRRARATTTTRCSR